MEFNFELGIDEQESFVSESGRFNVGDLLRKAARKYADNVAVSEPNRDVTYGELDDRVNRLSNSLLERYCEPENGTIAFLAENRGEVIEVMYAGAKTGCLVPGLNWRLEREELLHCVDLVEPDVLVVSERFREKAGWIEADAESDPEIVTLDGDDGDITYESLINDGSPDEPLPDRHIDPEQGLVVLYTSGTTGLPKGVVISHRAWLARGYTYIIDFDIQKGDCQLAWPPLFHIVSADWLPAIATVGGTYYPVDGFDTERTIEILQEDGGGIGWLVLLPGVVERLLQYIDEHDVDVDSFRPVRNIGALVDLVDPKKVERITETFDMPFKNSYGATENGNVLSAGNDIPKGVRPGREELAKVESSFVDMKLIDEDWNEVKERGELATRGPTICSGYLKNPEANAEDFNDGWFRTGDIFEHNDDGTYSFINRRKYLIKSGGENIYPAEIEQVLLEHELVEEATVVRVTDEKWGEVPRAIVGSHHPDEIDTDELMDMLDEQVARYKLPHFLDVVTPDQLPRSTTGKIVRDDLEEWDVDDSTRVRQV
ncbi:class I adenylate-forming enzyme family protein [Natronosalvus amylolyticus]|uniref:class I adenylate-forming enzyme family protein n=1 Tax=Natronosalvus amylolyticus TaxID=2961994 RepID=UPI0020C9BD8D|nr:class I adenylate-forming enzyme family protein [Natronosalvus amylolyticus]